MAGPLRSAARGAADTVRAHPAAFAGGGLVVLLAVALSVVLGFGLIVRAATLAPIGDRPTRADVEFAELDESSVVYASDGSTLAVLHGEVDRNVLPLAEIPEHVRHAVITAEDRRFREHDGYDPDAIGRALVENLRAGEVVEGGSTITQQLAKQNFVGSDETVERKLEELRFATVLEERYSKDELLERYLNEVYFGAGAYGIAAAAQEFFRVSPAELSADQAALLAGLIAAPVSLDPREHPERATARRDRVLEAMANAGHLSGAEAAHAQAAPLEVAPPRDAGERAEPFVVEAVKRQILDDPAFGDSREERAELLFSGGLEIHTTVVPGLQERARAVVAARLDGSRGPTAALVAVEPSSGRVLAMHGGAEFDEEQFNLATQGRRQPGSAFKPFVLAAALEERVPKDIRLEGDSPAHFDGVRDWTEADGGVRNFEDADYGQVGLREALVRSVNTAFADLVLTVGTEPVIDVAGRMGIDVQAAIGDDYGPAIALGGLPRGVTPLEMASAYGVFANGGRHLSPYIVERVVDRSGRELLAAQPEQTPALDPSVNAAMVDALREVVAEGTGTGARLPGRDVAGKTGTTQENADAWFVGATPALSTAVWVGHPDARIPMPGMTGGALPATLWRQFMAVAVEGPGADDLPGRPGEAGRP